MIVSLCCTKLLALKLHAKKPQPFPSLLALPQPTFQPSHYPPLPSSPPPPPYFPPHLTANNAPQSLMKSSFSPPQPRPQPYASPQHLHPVPFLSHPAQPPVPSKLLIQSPPLAYPWLVLWAHQVSICYIKHLTLSGRGKTSTTSWGICEGCGPPSAGITQKQSELETEMKKDCWGEMAGEGKEM